MPTLNSIGITSESTVQTDPLPIFSEEKEAIVASKVASDIDTYTNTSQSDLDILAKYQTSEIVDLTDPNNTQSERFIKSTLNLERSVPGINFGAEKSGPPTLSTQTIDRKGNKLGRDLRVKILVPPKYLDNSRTDILQPFQGIVFPYTPTISYEVKADYGTTNVMHNNFAVSFYQRSSISSIVINGKFSVNNENDALIYIGTMVLLRAISRMRSGGAKGGDVDSGAPPPVCRLFGYGDDQLSNVPVVLNNYRVEMPDAVDFFTVKYDDKVTSVPVLSTIALTLLPMYSRNEMQQFSVNNYLNGNFSGKGYI